MKTLVTHISPDLDAIASCWLIKRFLPGWNEAEIKFVNSGTTLDKKPPDENPNIIHVDTGLGKFDHHQTNEYTSATKLVYEYLLEKDIISQKLSIPLLKLVTFVNETDHFAEVNYPEPSSDKYDCCLHQMVKGVETIKNGNETMEIVFILLDSILNIFKNKVRAEKEIKQGFVFKSKWGKSLVMETKNEEAIKLAQKIGYTLVARKDPEKGYIRIKTLPDKKYDLTPLYNKLVSEDKKATWFLHISKNMLLNGSSSNSDSIPSYISIQRLIELIKNI